jgi:hypothetical protein
MKNGPYTNLYMVFTPIMSKREESCISTDTKKVCEKVRYL